MSSKNKYNNSSLASSNMVNARREEAAKLERQRLEINKKLEKLMKRYALVTGDTKVARRRHTIGLAPNDWTPAINASGIKRQLKAWEKILIILLAVALTVGIAAAVLHFCQIDVIGMIVDFVSKFVAPV